MNNVCFLTLSQTTKAIHAGKGIAEYLKVWIVYFLCTFFASVAQPIKSHIPPFSWECLLSFFFLGVQQSWEPVLCWKHTEEISQSIFGFYTVINIWCLLFPELPTVYMPNTSTFYLSRHWSWVLNVSCTCLVLSALSLPCTTCKDLKSLVKDCLVPGLLCFESWCLFFIF